VTAPAAFPGPGLDAVVFDMDGVVTQEQLPAAGPDAVR
jgi:hypothetical protein